MKYIYWYGAGLLAIGIPYVAFYNPYDLWGSIIAGAAGAALFLLALSIYSLKQSSSRKEDVITGIVCVMLIAGFALESEKHYTMTTYQRQTLLKIRTVIGSGIIITDKIYGTMMPTLRVYYRQPEKGKKMETIFREMYGASIADGSFNKYPPLKDYVREFDIMTYVSYQGDSVVQYICIDTTARGIDEHFKNASGHTGKLQYRSTLSKNGVKYERTN
ncbi:MAG: hypothetical protein WCI84_00245 [Bacteroidota bacterium]